MIRRRVALGDALSTIIDHRGKTPKKLGGDWSSSGHRVVSAINIKNNGVNDNDHHYVNDELYAKWMKQPLRAGDVLLTSEAPTGEVAYLASDTDWCLGQRVFGLRGTPGLLLGRYLYYLLRGGDVRHQLLARATGTTVSGIRQSELVKVELDLPPIEEQRAIAATLGGLDEKIESNRRLAEMSSRLVDALADELLTTEAMRTVTLADLVTFNAVTRQPEATGELIYVDIASVSSGVIDELEVTTWKAAPSRARRGVADGDVIYSTVRPGRQSFALIIDPDPRTVVSTGFAVMTPSAAIGSSLLTTLAGSPEFAGYLESVAHGSAYPAVSVDAMGAFPVSVPTGLAAVTAFEQATMPLRRRASQARAENSLLAALRDALIPGMLSGRIRVEGAVEALQEAVG